MYNAGAVVVETTLARPPGILTRAEVAVLMGVSPSTVESARAPFARRCWMA